MIITDDVKNMKNNQKSRLKVRFGFEFDRLKFQKQI